MILDVREGLTLLDTGREGEAVSSQHSESVFSVKKWGFAVRESVTEVPAAGWQDPGAVDGP